MNYENPDAVVTKINFTGKLIRKLKKQHIFRYYYGYWTSIETYFLMTKKLNLIFSSFCIIVIACYFYCFRSTTKRRIWILVFCPFIFVVTFIFIIISTRRWMNGFRRRQNITLCKLAIYHLFTSQIPTVIVLPYALLSIFDTKLSIFQSLCFCKRLSHSINILEFICDT